MVYCLRYSSTVYDDYFMEAENVEEAEAKLIKEMDEGILRYPETLLEPTIREINVDGDWMAQYYNECLGYGERDMSTWEIREMLTDKMCFTESQTEVIMAILKMVGHNFKKGESK